jgi:hypothetical protein
MVLVRSTVEMAVLVGDGEADVVGGLDDGDGLGEAVTRGSADADVDADGDCDADSDADGDGDADGDADPLGEADDAAGTAASSRAAELPQAARAREPATTTGSIRARIRPCYGPPEDGRLDSLREPPLMRSRRCWCPPPGRLRLVDRPR